MVCGILTESSDKPRVLHALGHGLTAAGFRTLICKSKGLHQRCLNLEGPRWLCYSSDGCGGGMSFTYT